MEGEEEAQRESRRDTNEARGMEGNREKKSDPETCIRAGGLGGWGGDRHRCGRDRQRGQQMLIYTIAQVKAAEKQKKPDVPATLARTPAERKPRWPSHVHAKVTHTHTRSAAATMPRCRW